MAETDPAVVQVVEMGLVAIDQIVVFASSSQAVVVVDPIATEIEVALDLVVELGLVAGVVG